MRLSLLLFALVLTAGACATSSTTTDDAMDMEDASDMSENASPASTVALGTPFSIEKDTWVEVADEDVEIRFNSVSDDSRCPANATCVRAGEAYAHFTLFEDGNEEPFTLEMPGMVMEMPDKERVQFQQVGRFSIALYLLQPYPELAAEVCPAGESLPDEVQRLVAEDRLLPGAQACEALGYKQVLAAMFPDRFPSLADPKLKTLDDAFERTKILTRRFAKQQRTWLKRFANVHWIDAAPLTADQRLDEARRFVESDGRAGSTDGHDGQDEAAEAS